VLVHGFRTWVGKGLTVGRRVRPIVRLRRICGDEGDPQLSRRLIYLSLLFAFPGVGAPAAAPSPSFTTAPRAVEPLTAAEESGPAAAAVARRFNPAMALPDADGPWPVSVRYMWGGGADLQARTVAADGKVLRTERAVANRDLDRTAWDALPSQDPRGDRIDYFIDGPGDDQMRQGVSDWRRRWADAADKTPTQYAHLFWLNRARGEIVVQYWFFYPFNEWVNHHEGDWEHVNVVLAGPPGAAELARAADYRAIGYEFYFHGFRFETDHPVRVAADQRSDSEGRDHPMVFVGGHGHALWWSGTQSGGSYPWPATYPGAGGGWGPFTVADDTRKPARVLEPDRFEIVMLPEPGRLDANAHPELSWLKLPFFAGQPRVSGNPPLVDRFGGGKPPRQPARRREWNAIGSRPLWLGSPVLDGDEPIEAVLARAGD
jgi:hypothetical protein